jgi:hypothetical protein
LGADRRLRATAAGAYWRESHRRGELVGVGALIDVCERDRGRRTPAGEVYRRGELAPGWGT